MSEALTASFRLRMQDELSSPLAGLEKLLQEIHETIRQIAAVADPFAGMLEPVAAATTGTEELNAALNETAAAATKATEGLDVLGESGAAAVTGAAEATEVLNEAIIETGQAAKASTAGIETIGTATEAAAAQSVSALGRIRGAMAALRDGPVGGFMSSVHGAATNFKESIEKGMGNAMGAAMAGFGLIEPVKAASEFDNTLRHIGIGLDMHGAANDNFTASFGREIDALARQTGQRGTDLAEAAGYFSREGYSLDEIRAVMPTVAHISTAYNAQPDAVARTTFAMQENLHVGAQDMPGALSAMALAGKQADIPFEKLAPLFPQVAAQAGAIGVHGREGVNDMAAALAVMRKNTGTEGEAVTDMRAFLQAITSPSAAKNFAKYGVDLLDTVKHARDAGVDPMIEVLQKVNRISNGGRDMKVIGELFHNEQDRGFVNALLGHLDQYFSIRGKVAGADPNMVNQDFATGSKSMSIELQSFEETLAQLERRIGTGFAPILVVLTHGLNHVIEAFDWLDKHVPGATTGIIGTVGAMLAMATILGALGAIWPPLVAGFGLLKTVIAGLGGPFTLLAVIVTACIMDIVRHWDRFAASFRQSTHGIQDMLRGVGNFIAGVFTGNWKRAIAGIQQAGRGLVEYWRGMWSVVRQLFADFTGWIDGWTGGFVSRLMSKMTSAWGALVGQFTALIARLKAPWQDFEKEIANSWVGRHLGMSGGAPAAHAAAPGPATVATAGQSRSVIQLELPEGVKAKQVDGPQGAVTTSTRTDRGRMVARP
ncbi:phage tail tape measure protein [Komagataeibacter xylinus]|uniref:phage tail tape measure protein n=1 Tax=Komagataeibacter xylinus TaxID=28448 RepID=UPI00280A6BE5|nr:phage tail tape measure protein [Komagataeibacter xylinus]